MKVLCDKDIAVLGQFCAEVITCLHPYTKCYCRVMLKISNKIHQGAQTIIISLVIFTGVALKLENVDSTFSSFNSFPSLPLVATDDRKWFQCLTKLYHYF